MDSHLAKAPVVTRMVQSTWASGEMANHMVKAKETPKKVGMKESGNMVMLVEPVKEDFQIKPSLMVLGGIIN